MNNFNKKIIIVIILAAFAGGVIGSVISISWAKSNVFQSLYDDIISTHQTAATQNSADSAYQSPSSYEQAVINAVQTSSPSVVSIIISKDVPIVEQCPYNPFSDLPQGLQQLFGSGTQFYQPCQKGTQKQEVGGGSGFIISNDGMILTNKHVVSDNAASYTVLTNDGKKYDAKVIAQDPVLDLAIVKINAKNLPVLPLGNSNDVKLGQTTIAIGNALGEFRNTVSVGVVSGLSRTITASGSNGASETIEGVMQTDAAINEGNSGGPLLNLNGQVIGVNVAMVSGAQNIGFAIPINQVKRAIDSVKKTGTIVVPYLGVRYLSITSDLASQNKLPVNSGAWVHGGSDGPAVISGSPADKAGIKDGDIITQINGQAIDQNNSLSAVIQNYNVGDAVDLKILRNGKTMDIKITLEQRPANP